MVSEVIHGTPSRFSDPARFSFAHGGKNSTPFPVPTKVYDETIDVLKASVEKAKIGDQDKLKAIAKLTKIAKNAEAGFTVNQPDFQGLLDKEKRNSWKYGGRTLKGFVRQPKEKKPGNGQMDLFDA